MGADERFDIFDRDRNWIGTATRSEVHALGLWHQTFQCWVLSYESGEPSLLFQMRHPGKDTFPGLLDISCAGHLLEGEKPADGVRELEEELGLIVDFQDLLPCGVFTEEDVLADGRIDREFCHVFLYCCDQPISNYRLQADEVTGLFRIVLRDIWLLVSGQMEQVTAKGVEADSNGTLQVVERTVDLQQLVPHERRYYELVFSKMESAFNCASFRAQ